MGRTILTARTRHNLSTSSPQPSVMSREAAGRFATLAMLSTPFFIKEAPVVMRLDRQFARHALLLLVAFLSAGAGVALLWRGLTPEALAEMPATQIFILLGLIGLPLATFMAIESDRRKRRVRDAVLGETRRASDVRLHQRHDDPDDRRSLTHRKSARARESTPVRAR